MQQVVRNLLLNTLERDKMTIWINDPPKEEDVESDVLVIYHDGNGNISENTMHIESGKVWKDIQEDPMSYDWEDFVAWIKLDEVEETIRQHKVKQLDKQ